MTLHIIRKIAFLPILLSTIGCSPVFMATEHNFPLPNCTDNSSDPCIETAKFHDEPQTVVNNDLPNDRIAAGIFSSKQRSHQRPKIGLAFAGGGSKSAPFAMGAIKRFIDENWIKNVEYISSVSGGGYAALYLYDKAMALVEKRKTCATGDNNCLRQYFFDARLECYKGECKNTLKYLTADHINSHENLHRSRSCKKFYYDINGHQEHLECYQDILSSFRGGIQENSLTSYLKMVPETIFELSATATLLPFHYLANAVFDWRVKLSPTQWAYEAGIFRTYGYEPEANQWEKTLLVEFMPDIQNHTFQKLETVYDKTAKQYIGHPMPIWIMNATTPDNGTWVNKIFKDQPYDLNKNIFEIGPFHFGAGIFDYVHGSPNVVGLDLPTAVAASAAFFDASKRDFAIPPAAVYTGLFTLNLSWGLDIPNYNQSNLTRIGHSFLPWPFYYLQGNFEEDDRDHNIIHLSDGGQSGDNLGFTTLLRRNVENIILFDGAQDKSGELSHLNELCAANRFLNIHGYKLEFKGTPDSDDTSVFDLNDKCDMTEKLELKKGVNPYHWTKPVWVGYIVKDQVHPTTKISQFGQNVFYIKSALIKKEWQAFSQSQLKIHPYGTCKADQEDPNFYCPLAWYYNDFGEDDPNFPQDATVWTTYNGNAKRFKVYRDLGWFLAGKLRQQPELQSLLK